MSTRPIFGGVSRSVSGIAMVSTARFVHMVGQTLTRGTAFISEDKRRLQKPSHARADVRWWNLGVRKRTKGREDRRVDAPQHRVRKSRLGPGRMVGEGAISE